MNDHALRLYLHRLGFSEAEPPSLDFLTRLQQAHVERISWQTIDVFAGRPEPIDAASAVALIVAGRSGYCFHLNTAFADLLRTLGFSVRCHRAGVQARGAVPHVDSFHLGLTVELRGDIWLVDAGLGDRPWAPIPVRPGTYQQGPLTYALVDSPAAPGGWRLVHDARAGYEGVDFAPEPVSDLGVFSPQHQHLSTAPDSPWVNRLCPGSSPTRHMGVEP
jgi:N-hydroxyarylamine O-acetyltransferase